MGVFSFFCPYALAAVATVIITVSITIARMAICRPVRLAMATIITVSAIITAVIPNQTAQSSAYQ